MVSFVCEQFVYNTFSCCMQQPQASCSSKGATYLVDPAELLVTKSGHLCSSAEQQVNKAFKSLSYHAMLMVQ